MQTNNWADSLKQGAKALSWGWTHQYPPESLLELPWALQKRKGQGLGSPAGPTCLATSCASLIMALKWEFWSCDLFQGVLCRPILRGWRLRTSKQDPGPGLVSGVRHCTLVPFQGDLWPYINLSETIDKFPPLLWTAPTQPVTCNEVGGREPELRH